MSSNRRQSEDSPLSSPSSPFLSPGDPSEPLVPHIHQHPTFDFSSDSEDDQIFDPAYDERRPVISPLPPSAVFLYLLSPYLKFGAMLLPKETLSAWQIVVQLIFFAALSVFSRHVLYLLARYLRKAHMDDIVSSTFTRGRGHERKQEIIESLSRFCTGILRVLLGALYLQKVEHVLRVLLPGSPFPSMWISNIILALLIIPISVVHSLGATPVIYANMLSIFTYVLWLGCTCYAQIKGISILDPAPLSMGSLWQGTTIIAFTFASPSPLHLYASLKATLQPFATRTPKFRSFRTLSALSVTVALALLIPLAFVAHHPESQEQAVFLTQFTAALTAATLLLAIPSIIITTPSIPLPERLRSSKYSLSRAIIYLAMFLLSVVATPISEFLSNILLTMALSATYVLPAVLHITAHQFSRPLTIVIPTHSPTRRQGRSESPSQEELLQRKERALQKRQMMKRLVWDIGVWVLLIPVGVGGLIWAAGSLAGRW